MAGRRPKPTKLKIANGNPGKRKLNALEPQPAIVEPVVPAFLSKPARKWWAMLSPMMLRLKILTESDQIALALLCEQAVQADEATRLIRKGGIMIKKQLYDRSGKKVGQVPTLNPALKVQLEATKQLKNFLVEFGFTPASRTKVSMVQNEPTKDPIDELRARAKRSR